MGVPLRGLKMLARALVMAAILGGPAMAQDFVEVAPGVMLNVVEAGEETAEPTLVLVPGWSMASEVWRTQIDHFSQGRRVIAIDPRSQGESTKTGYGNTPATRARDLRAVLEARGVRRPVLVGWSQGVQDLAAYVAQYGTDDLAGLVLVDSAIAGGARSMTPENAEANTVTFVRMAIYQQYQAEYVQGFLEAIITRPQPQERLDRLAADAMKTPPAIGVAMMIADLFGDDHSAAADLIRRPTLIVASASSPELDRQRALAERIPGARFEIVEDAGHALFVDQPERFNALLTEFLAALPAEPET